MDTIKFDGIEVDVAVVRQKLEAYDAPLSMLLASNRAEVHVTSKNEAGCFLNWTADPNPSYWHWNPQALRELIDWLIRLEAAETRRLAKERS